MVCAQGQAMTGRHAVYEYFDAAAQFRMNHAGRISISKSVQLAIPHGGSLARKIQELLAAFPAYSFDRDFRAADFLLEGYIGSPKQRYIVIEELPRSGQANA